MISVSRSLFAALGLTVALGACGSTADDDRITVLAAASLTEAFGELADAFGEANGNEVVFSFAGSSSLAGQVLGGAPADVIATADDEAMARLGETLAADPVVFATNRAAIVVEAGNPLGITSLADLADPSMVVVLCGPAAACGRYAREVLDLAGVEVTPSSLEETPKAVITKVALGEADAGIVFASDIVTAPSSVTGIEIAAAFNIIADYPIAAIADAPNPAGAQAFIDFVISPAGREILERNGFGAP